MDFISKRIKNLSESETLAMTRLSRELKAQGHDVINLSIGEPDFNTPEFVKEAGKKAIDDNITHYPPVPGYEELRKAICKKLKRDNNLDYEPAQIIASTGAKQSLINVLLSVIDDGDEVIVPTPYWVSYKEMVKIAGGTMINIPAKIETDFKVTPEQVENAITKKTKAILFNSPSNPTGSVYSKEEMEAIANVLAKHPHILIISDEIYEHINFLGKHESFAQFENVRDRVVLINGVSKGFAMTGWRLGFAAASVDIAKACNKIQGQFTSGTCSISQMAALAAFETDPNEVEEMKVMLDAFKERRNLVLSLLDEIPGIITNKPNGAFYIFPDVSSFYGKSVDGMTIENSADLCMYLLNEKYIALVPGSAFGDPDCIRLSYATSNDILIEAMKRLKEGLAKLK
jgi:aspartate aminotransferase